MDTIINFISYWLSFVMRGCYAVLGNYGLSLIVFTLITKVILFPINIFIQKNSIKMVQMQPQIDALKIKYVDDKDKFVDEQLALYKKNHYHSSLSIIPLIFQLALVMGLLGIVYNPLTYVLGIDNASTDTLNVWLAEDMGITDAGSSAQLEITRLIQEGHIPPNTVGDETIDLIKGFGLDFCGFNLGLHPSFKGNYILLLIPILAGLSALIMCVVQNRVNVLQITAGKLNKYGMTIFMIAFSSYFAFIVPAGVGLYWIFGNLFAVPNMLILNAVIPPKKYIDIDYLRKIREQKILKEEKYKKYHKKERADYKRFSAVRDMRLMFYSESNGFYKYYAGTIDYICEHSDIEIHYVTSDPEDSIFNDPREQIHAYYISRDKYIIPLFMKLDCDMCVMTMPDLEKYHIKRSRVRNDIEYVYISHGMGSNNMTLRKGALDWYDTVYCVGIDAEKEILETEELYHTPHKRLIEAGYTLIDDMIENFNSAEHKENHPRKILIAPSWQNDNIIDLCINELVDSFAGKDYDIIIRPHPQMVRHNPEKFDILHEKYDGTNVEVQTDFSSNSPVLEADVLITDWSDISFEFAFTTKRPVLFINTPMKIMNPEYDRIKTVPINIALRNIIGKSLDVNETDKAPEIVSEMIEHRGEYRKAIDEALEEHIFNVGKSREIYGRYIIKRLAQ